MTERLDLYAPIHKGLRHALSTCLLELGQMDPNDPVDAARALAQLREVLSFLEDHLSIEERFVHAALDRVAAGGEGSAVSHAREDHAGHEREFAALRALIADLERAEPLARRARAHALYVAFSRFAGENLVHMAYEETALNPALWAAFSDQELLALRQAILAAEPPASLERTVRWMLPALDPQQRAMLQPSQSTAAA